MTERHRKIVWAAAVAVFLLFTGVVGWRIGKPIVELAGEPQLFREWVDGHGLWGRILFVGMVVLQVVVALIPGEPLELLGGYAFGALEGTLLTLLGIVIGSAMVFALVRRFGVRLVEVFFDQEKIRQAAFLRDPRKTRLIAFLLMLIPGTPKDFLSYFAGLTKLTMGEWLAIVTVARIPSVIGSTITGGAAGEANFVLAAVVFGLTLALSGAGVWYYRRICRKQQDESEPDDGMELPKAG